MKKEGDRSLFLEINKDESYEEEHHRNTKVDGRYGLLEAAV
jgi:hypothetical protein